MTVLYSDDDDEDGVAVPDADGNTLCVDEQEVGLLFDATPGCPGVVSAVSGGGVKCSTCPGWFCF